MLVNDIMLCNDGGAVARALHALPPMEATSKARKAASTTTVECGGVAQSSIEVTYRFAQPSEAAPLVPASGPQPHQQDAAARQAGDARRSSAAGAAHVEAHPALG